jgi:tRNA-binding EMAP/Myf-like protein
MQVGRVISVDDHPSGSDKLWLCKVDVGSGTERQASNTLAAAVGCCWPGMGLFATNSL